MSPQSAAKLEKKPLSYSVLLIGVISLMTVGSWVTFEVYRSFTKTTVPRVLQSQIKPIKSKIDEKLINDIATRRTFSDFELQGIVPFIPPDEAERIEKERQDALEANSAGDRLSPFASLTPTPSIATESSTIQSTNSGEIAL